ncbi:MAG: GAK system ATP-grasp enzyme [Mariprofundales bacterium]
MSSVSPRFATANTPGGAASAAPNHAVERVRLKQHSPKKYGALSPKPPRIGIIGTPGAWSTEVLADRIEAKTGFRLVVDMGKVHLDLTCNRLFFGDHDLCALDGMLVKKISRSYEPDTLDRLELLRVAEQHGVRLFSPALNILRLIDRLSCTITLRNHDIPMPPTCITSDHNRALEAITHFGGAVLKPLYSTKARGMVFIDGNESQEKVWGKLNAFHADNPMIYIQKKISLPGQDLGMVFLGGNHLGTYARVAQGDSWNTTIHSGGKYAPYQPSAALIELAHRAQQPFGLDFTTVDVAESDAGPIVFEVSAFGGFRGAKEGIGLDAAARSVDYALEQLS